jgi:hypothetical protein
MAKNRSHRRRTHSKTRSMRRTRSQRGGDLAGNPASSWGWVNGTLGNGWTQFMNSLTLQPGQNIATMHSNNSVPVGNINAQNAQPMLNKNMGGGKRHKRNKNRSRRGGSRRGGCWGAVASQAAVPAILLAAQQSYGKSRRSR